MHILRFVAGTATPIAGYALISILVGRFDNTAPTLAWWLAVFGLIGTSAFGFFFTTKPLTRRQTLLVGVVYFPVVIALSFYAGLVVVGRLYGNFI